MQHKWLTIATVLVAAAILTCNGRRNKLDLEKTANKEKTPFDIAVGKHPNCRGGTLAAQVPFEKKKAELWCWAASGTMISASFGQQHSVKQCTQAQEFCGARCAHVDCCADPTPAACVIPGVPTIDRHGFSAPIHTGPLTPEQIVDELGCKKKPFIYAWKDGGEGGHMMVAVDFLTKDGVDYVITHDPDGYKAFLTSYEVYKDGFFEHGDDIVPIRRGGS